MTESEPLSAYWSRDTGDVIAGLHSSAEGLTSAEATARLAQYGRNILRARRRATVLTVFLNQFRSPIVIILLVATGVAAAIGDWIDALVITVIVLGSAVLSTSQEYRASNAAEALRARIQTTSDLLRDGNIMQVPTQQVVPGDIVQLSAGSLVPADGILLQADDLHVNQAALTGETFPVEKVPGPVSADADLAQRSNCVFMGTDVRNGTGRALIVKTGSATVFGQIARQLSDRTPETEFERGVRHLGLLLSETMFVLVFIIFAANVLLNRPTLDALLFSVALAVGLTPQLLPAIISVNLSHGAQAMAAAGVIVRRLSSIENLGSMDVLCTDKTGTLTEGVVHLDRALDSRGQPSDEVLLYASLNASLQTGLANPLDQAILAIKTELPLVTKVDEIPYDFTRKRLSVVIRQGEAHRLILKGALDHVLQVCTEVRVEGGTIVLSDAQREAIRVLYTTWSSQGLRVLGVATGELPERTTYTQADEQGLTFIGFLLFLDPPKPGIKEVIADLAKLGVRLQIITGDNRLVASHLAEMLSIPQQAILTGADLSRLSDEALWHRVEHASLFAEVDPNQKARIILALRRMGHVVGFIGDGVNDAPALHSADVGISVDNAVDVAKEAADFVLLKQDLGVLHRGIIEGRRTFANTLKYIFMATSANFGNMFSVAGASLFLPFLPMLPKQILLINFLTDLPEMAIAGDNVDTELIERPHRWNVHFIRRFMAVFGPLSSVFDYLTFGVLLLAAVDTHVFRSAWFIESVVSAAMVVMVLRTRHPLARSKPGRTLMLMTVLVILVALVLPFSPLAEPLELRPLPFPVLLGIAGVVLLYLTAAERVRRWFFSRYRS